MEVAGEKSVWASLLKKKKRQLIAASWPSKEEVVLLQNQCFGVRASSLMVGEERTVSNEAEKREKNRPKGV